MVNGLYKIAEVKALQKKHLAVVLNHIFRKRMDPKAAGEQQILLQSCLRAAVMESGEKGCFLNSACSGDGEDLLFMRRRAAVQYRRVTKLQQKRIGQLRGCDLRGFVREAQGL